MKCSDTIPIFGYQQLWLLDLEKRILISVEFRKIIFIRYVFIHILQYTVKVEKGDYVLQLQVGNRDIFVDRYYCFIH